MEGEEPTPDPSLKVGEENPPSLQGRGWGIGSWVYFRRRQAALVIEVDVRSCKLTIIEKHNPQE